MGENVKIGQFLKIQLNIPFYRFFCGLSENAFPKQIGRTKQKLWTSKDSE